MTKKPEALELHTPNSNYFKRPKERTSEISPPASPAIYAPPPPTNTLFIPTTGNQKKKENVSKCVNELLDNISSTAELNVNGDYSIILPTELNVTLLPHQQAGLAWMIRQEASDIKGGILADDMGLGKTIQTLALIAKQNELLKEKGPTLIVAPVSLMFQWKQEIFDKTLLKVIIYHGNNREKDALKLAQTDIVITTYNTLSSEETFKKKGTILSTIFDKVKWLRVVIDEGHVIKNHKTGICESVCQLTCKYRWILTGTPIQNGVNDLYSYFKFLKISPYNDYTTFKSRLAQFDSRGALHPNSLKIIQLLMKNLLLRRIKTMTDNGKSLIELPGRSVEHVVLEFSTSEREFYETVENKMRALVESYAEHGGSIGKNMAQLFLMLLRLRQICCHANLSKFDLNEETTDRDYDDRLEIITSYMTNLEIMDSSSFCKICFGELDWGCSINDGICSTCAKLTEKKVVTSTKFDWIVQKLNEFKKTCPNEKTIIYSQWTSLLDLLQVFLRNRGYDTIRFDGSMAANKRDEAIKTMIGDPTKTIMLVSLKAGNVGLNLVFASKIFFVDLWWNPALEEQAIDRVHRIGQTRNVDVYKITIAGTVEDRILAMQARKRMVASQALGETGEQTTPSNAMTYKDLLQVLKGKTF